MMSRSIGRRTRARRLALAVGGLGLASLLVTGAVLAQGDGFPRADEAPVLTTDELVFTFVGDTLMADGAQPKLDRHGHRWMGARLPAFNPDSVVVANLEGPITERTEVYDLTRTWTYNADPASAEALATIGVDAVSLANNHTLDRGPEGLFDTVAHLEAAGIAGFGAGEVDEVAQLPLLVDGPDGRVALFGFTDVYRAGGADAEVAGTNLLTENGAVRAVAMAESVGADTVIANVHWGGNYAAVDERQQAWAVALAEAGFDLVIGHGAHSTQPFKLVDGVPVIYSLGNFLFGTPGRWTDENPGYGVVAEVSIDPGQAIEVTLSCIVTDNQVVDYQPRPCDEAEWGEMFATVAPKLTVDPITGTASVSVPID